MSTDLKDRIDLSFGDGPGHRPMADRLVEGRRALRRRRRTAGLVAAGAVAVAAATPAALGSRDDGGGTTDHTGVAAPPVQAIDLPLAPSARVDASTAPLLMLHGTLFRRDPSVVVTRLLRLHVGAEPAAAALVRIDRSVVWVYVVGSPSQGLTVTSAPRPKGQSLSAWAQAQRRASRSLIDQGSADGGVPGVIAREQSPVRYVGDRLVAKAGASITLRLEHPAYSAQAVPAGCTTEAVAVTDGDGDFFVLGYTCPDGTWDLFTEPAGQRADTLASWLDAVKAAQDGGAGIR